MPALGGPGQFVLAVKADGSPDASGPGTNFRGLAGRRELAGKGVELWTMSPPDRGKIVLR